MVFCLITMFFSGGLIPFFILIDALNLIDNPLVLILPVLINVWNMIILKTFFENIPQSLEESAHIDGAGYYKLFFSIVIPLSVPSLATVGLFTAVVHWNSWFDAYLFVQTRTWLYPLQTLLVQIINQEGAKDYNKPQSWGVTDESIKYATMMIATIPIVLVYPFIQKYFIRGILLGSIKE